MSKEDTYVEERKETQCFEVVLIATGNDIWANCPIASYILSVCTAVIVYCF